jgi:hypothetical protein
MTTRRRIEASACRFIPSSLEMEEFFSAAEQQEQHVFREKYDLLPSFSVYVEMVHDLATPFSQYMI